MFPMKQFISVQTRSGREFRFEIADYRVCAETTPAAVEAIAAQIVKNKYRFCQWDRDHPEVDVESEILEVVIAWLQHCVDRDKRANADRRSGSTECTVGRSPWNYADSVTFSFSVSKPATQSPLPIKIVWGVYDNAGGLVKELPYSEEAKARELARELTEEKQSEHFVQKMKRTGE